LSCIHSPFNVSWFTHFKIDGDLIRGLAASPMDQLVVGAIVGIARGMGKQTIAEFVTDDETVRLLEKAGVDYAQGYGVGRPRPLGELLLPALGRRALLAFVGTL
jgi:EAL domain-containing protein (putative c-di-GMP-specific phosphodiesterase class I)